MWVAWETYLFLKMIDYVAAMQWSYLEIKIPAEAGETPKAMEVAFEVFGGVHKNPDLVERFFDGYQTAHYSCELHCTPGKVRYILVVPTTTPKVV